MVTDTTPNRAPSSRGLTQLKQPNRTTKADKNNEIQFAHGTLKIKRKTKGKEKPTEIKLLISPADIALRKLKAESAKAASKDLF